MFNSIGRRITLLMIFMASVPLGIVGIIVSSNAFNLQQQQVIESEEQLLNRVAREIETFILQPADQLALITSANTFFVDDETTERGLYNLLFSQNVYEQILVLDANGQVTINIQRFGNITQQADTDFVTSEFFINPQTTGDIYYGDVAFDDTTGEPLLPIAIPLENIQTGAFTGVAIAAFRFRSVWDLITDININSNKLVYVVNEENNIVAHSNSSIVLQNISFVVPTTSGIHTGLDGDRVILVSTPIHVGNQTFTVVSEIPTAIAFAPAYNTIVTTVIVLVITITIASIVGVIAARTIARPIEQLAKTASSIADGNFTQRTVVRTTDEIGLLASAFNQMAERLQGFIQTLENRVFERTRDLAVAAQVSQQINQYTDLSHLLPSLVTLLKDNFNLYHVSIFIYDRNDDLLKLAAAADDVGKLMVESGYELQLEGHGIVPFAARTDEPQIIGDVISEPSYLPNPLLPLTRSELALPMRYGTHFVGVLDLQSSKFDYFGEDEVKLMTSLAEQIAIGIRNTQLFETATQAREEAERANSVKSMFLASMSHELRTPLNAIINFTKFVSRGVMGPINERQIQALGNVITSGEHLLALINDVLDISKIESGSLNLFLEEDVDLNEVIEQAHQTGVGLIEEKPVELLLNIDETLPSITCDRQRILQVLLNVVSNACKFTAEGYVTISAQAEDDVIHFSVSDTGPGIAKQDFDAVFETFKQTTTGLRQAKGTGLGMPISQSLITAHGGTMWLESNVGEGTTFHFTVPMQSQEKKVALLPKVREASS